MAPYLALPDLNPCAADGAWTHGVVLGEGVGKLHPHGGQERVAPRFESEPLAVRVFSQHMANRGPQTTQLLGESHRQRAGPV